MDESFHKGGFATQRSLSSQKQKATIDEYQNMQMMIVREEDDLNSDLDFID